MPEIPAVLKFSVSLLEKSQLLTTVERNDSLRLLTDLLNAGVRLFSPSFLSTFPLDKVMESSSTLFLLQSSTGTLSMICNVEGFDILLPTAGSLLLTS